MRPRGAFFGGVFKVLVPDNLKPVVTDADAVNPRLSTGWLDYAQHAGFVTDPARVRSPKDKPRGERAVQFVRGNFWAGEHFSDLVDAQARAEQWCSVRAGMRIHGTIQARPVEVFTRVEAPVLLPVPQPYDQPVFTRVRSTATTTSRSPGRCTRCPRPTWASTWTLAPTVSSSSSTPAGPAAGAWSRPTPARHPGGGPRTGRTCPSTGPGMPYGT